MDDFVKIIVIDMDHLVVIFKGFKAYLTPKLNKKKSAKSCQKKRCEC